MLPGLTLVIGGAASGKTAYAEELVKRTGRGMIYLATAEAHDDEMRAKINRHRDLRGQGWQTIEEPLDLGRTLAGISGDNTVMVDCVTMWLSNQMMAERDPSEAEAELMAGLALCSAPVVLVTNEVGHSVVPENALARRFREAQGRINQKLATRAGLVINVIAGLPQALKGELP